MYFVMMFLQVGLVLQ